MKNLFIFIVGAICLISTLVRAEDLPDKPAVKYAYDALTIHKVEGVDADIEYVPQTATSIAFFRGTVKVKLLVEGNICSGKPETLGYGFQFKDIKPYLNLYVATPVTKFNELCLQYSRLVPVEVDLMIDEAAFEDDPINRTLAFVDLNGEAMVQEVEIRIVQLGKKLQAVVE